MSHRFRDRHGDLRIVQGRQVTRPFGRIGDWPERVQGLAPMQAAESAANERRAAYRAWEARQPCGGCGHPAPGHTHGCVWPDEHATRGAVMLPVVQNHAPSSQRP